MKVKRRDTYVCISVNMYCYRGVGVCHIAWSFFWGGGGARGRGISMLCAIRAHPCSHTWIRPSPSSLTQLSNTALEG